MNKKKLLSLALVVILITTISFSSLAWFSDADQVTNKFMVAGSDNAEPDEIFSVDVKENVLDENGNPTSTETGKTYKEILPGDHLKKEPVVRNTGAYDQYIRVIVTISDAKAWVDALGQGFDAATLFEGFDGSKWGDMYNSVSDNQNLTYKDDLTFVVYYKDILAPGQEITVFNYLNIPTSLTQAQAAAFSKDDEPGFTVDIKAQAVQTENVVKENHGYVTDARSAFGTVNMSVSD